MAPKAKAKGKAVAAKAAAKGKAKAQPKAGSKRPADAAEAPAAKRLARGSSAELLDKAKRAAASGKASGSKRRVVDTGVPGRDTMSVYQDYSVKLNQTNIGSNNNKFYMIQVLEGGGKYYSWNRWGRVGEPGQNKLVPHGAPEGAIKDFESKFRDKTQNKWDDREAFAPKPGKYTIVETEETEGGGNDAPMGKLTEAQIGKGQVVLDNLGKELKKGRSDITSVQTLSSRFYTLIPHDFGRKVPPAISTNDMLQAKVELLKFYLRMGFDEVEEAKGLTPIAGVLDLPLPAKLADCGVGSSSVRSCMTEAAKMAASKAGKPTKPMSADLYGAILLYTSNAIYQDLNQCLRDENRAKIKKYFKYLRMFFEAMSCLPKQKRTLWRGLSVDLFDNSQYALNSVVTWWGVSSTTADKKVAYNFAKGCGGKCTVLTIETTTSSDISDITFYSNEKESLLAPGTQLKVTSKKRSGNVTEISLKEVGRVIG